MRTRCGGSESGWALVESLVSAAILVIVVSSVLVVLDGSSATVAQSKGRSVASSVAEEDQERLKGLAVTTLSNYAETRDVVAGGVKYTVTSRGEWVADKSGTALSCSSTAGSADYLRLSSTVSSPSVVGSEIAPVRLESIVAPPVGAFGSDRGTLATKITDRSGTATTGMSVGLAGPVAMTASTNDAGCAVFGKIPAGSYQVNLSATGFVSPTGATAVAQPATVTAGNVTTVPVQYDRAAHVIVSFDTKIGGAVPQPARATSIVAANPAIPPAGLRAFLPTPVGPRTSITAANLFPFTDGYAVFGGSCASADPSRYVDGYYDGAQGFVNLDPGQTKTITVRMPALNFRVTRGGNKTTAPVYNNPLAHVVVTPAASDCAEKYSFNGLTTAGGLAEPGLPFGEYSVCVDDGQRHTTVANVLNTDPAGTPFGADGLPVNKIWINTSIRNGVCT